MKEEEAALAAASVAHAHTLTDVANYGYWVVVVLLLCNAYARCKVSVSQSEAGVVSSDLLHLLARARCQQKLKAPHFRKGEAKIEREDKDLVALV